jgi:hypothetical protein
LQKRRPRLCRGVEFGQRRAQEAINAAGANGGTSLAFGVSAANDAKIRAANVALQVAQQAAQVAKAASEQVAKDTLRSTGDYAPA